MNKSRYIIFIHRYASLYFCCAIEQNDNELLTLEIIHRYVELLDKYFGSVSLRNVKLYVSRSCNYLILNVCLSYRYVN